MKIKKTKFDGLYIINLNSFKDDRGEFLRLVCKKENKNFKFNNPVQVNHSINKYSRTFRGFHYQIGKYAEDKLVYCVKGKILDLAIDLRKFSKTYLKTFMIELGEKANKSVYIPRGFAHAFYTLKNNTEVIYFSSNYYNPKYEKGIRWNDPLFKLKLPSIPKKISEKDSNFSNF